MRRMTGVAFAALAVAAAACAGAQGGGADAGPPLAGVIVGADVAATPARVVVDGAPAAPGSGAGERFVLLVSRDTEISVPRADGTAQRGGVADLVAGARVEAEHTGTELRSLPPQYYATRIRVLPRT